jgi:hypothetical protein
MENKKEWMFVAGKPELLFVMDGFFAGVAFKFS